MVIMYGVTHKNELQIITTNIIFEKRSIMIKSFKGVRHIIKPLLRVDALILVPIDTQARIVTYDSVQQSEMQT